MRAAAALCGGHAAVSAALRAKHNHRPGQTPAPARGAPSCDQHRIDPDHGISVSSEKNFQPSESGSVASGQPYLKTHGHGGPNELGPAGQL